MSIDFGPIPFPQSPIQDYFERRRKIASEGSSPAIPRSPSISQDDDMPKRLSEALARVAEKQRKEKKEDQSVMEDKFKTQPDTLRNARRPSATSTGYSASSAYEDGIRQLKRRSLTTSGDTTQPSSGHSSG